MDPQVSLRTRRRIWIWAISLALLLVVLAAVGCGSTESIGQTGTGSNQGGGNTTGAGITPGQTVYGRFFVVPSMLFTDPAVTNAVLAARSELLPQGYSVSPRGDVLSWPPSPGYSWVITLGDQTVLVGPDGTFALAAPAAGSSTTATITNPTNRFAKTTLDISLLSATAADAPILFAAVPFKTSGMSDEAAPDAAFSEGDLEAVQTAFGSGPVAPRQVQAKQSGPPEQVVAREVFCGRQAGAVTPADIAALAGKRQQATNKAVGDLLEPLAKVLGIPVLTTLRNGAGGVLLAPIRSGPLPGTYPPLERDILTNCPQFNGPTDLASLNPLAAALNGALAQVEQSSGGAYFGSTCDMYVLDATCMNERPESDAELLSFLAVAKNPILSPSNQLFSAVGGGVVKLVTLIPGGTLGPGGSLDPRSPVALELPAVLVDKDFKDGGQIHCVNNHRGRMCGQFLKGDLSIKDAASGLIASTNAGRDLPQLATILTGRPLPTELNLRVPAGDRGTLTVHNNGTYGVTLVYPQDQNPAQVSFTAETLGVAGVPSLQTISGNIQRLLHFDKEPPPNFVEIPLPGRAHKSFRYATDRTLNYAVPANATPGQKSSFSFVVDDSSVAVSITVGSPVEISPPSAQIALTKTEPTPFSFSGPAIQELADYVQSLQSNGVVTVGYRWSVTGSAGGTVSNGLQQGTTVESTAINVQYLKNPAAQTGQTDELKLEVLIKQLGQTTVFGSATATVTMGEGGRVSLAPASLNVRPAQNVPITASVQNIPLGANLLYQWSVAGTLGGTLNDNAGNTGTSFESASPNITYFSNTAPDDTSDVVTVTVTLVGSPNQVLGTATSTLSRGLTQVTSFPAGELPDAVTYGNNRFVSIGTLLSFTGNRDTRTAWTSPDGKVWTRTPNFIPAELGSDNQSVFLGFLNGEFVALQDDRLQSLVYITRSSDPSTSSTTTQISEYRIQSLTYVNGRYIGVGFRNEPDAPGVILASPDLNTWTLLFSDPNHSWSSVATGDGKIVATGTNIVTSSDGGDHWQTANSGTSESVTTPVFAAGKWVAVTRGGEFLNSTDALQWSVVSSLPDVHLEFLTYGAGEFKVLAGGRTPNFPLESPRSVYTSSDGINFTLDEGPVYSGIFWLTAGPPFVAAGLAGDQQTGITVVNP
jgi:hypothetical protein